MVQDLATGKGIQLTPNLSAEGALRWLLNLVRFCCTGAAARCAEGGLACCPEHNQPAGCALHLGTLRQLLCIASRPGRRKVCTPASCAAAFAIFKFRCAIG